MSAFYRELEPVSKQLTIVVGLTVVGFMAFGLALSFYRNVLFEDQLRVMSHENDLLRGRIDESRADLDYYRSAQYKDKYAKENLGRIVPGEKIMIIREQGTEEVADLTQEPSEEQQAEFEAYLRQMPVIEHWKLFLFRRDQLEKLRRGL